MCLKKTEVTEKIYGFYILWEKISEKFLLIFGIAVGFLFAYWAGRYSNVFPEDYGKEMAGQVPDSLLLNLLVWLGINLFFFAAWKFFTRVEKECLQKYIHILVIVLSILLGTVLTVWVTIAHYVPIADQQYVYEAAQELTQGNYQSMEIGEYFYYYPYQLDQTFLFQLVFRLFHCNSFKLIQYINVVSIVFAVYFGYLLVKQITDEPAVELCYIFFGYTFVPLFLYSQFVYGDVLSVTAGSIGIWATVSLFKNRKKRYAVYAILAVLTGLLIKKNFYIILIAILIGMIYQAIHEKSWKIMVLSVLCLIIPLGASKLIRYHYETASGLEVSRGLPLSYFLDGALQEAPDGPGAWNMDLLLDYQRIAECDYDLFDALHKEVLKGRIRDLWNAPEYTISFFQRKTLQQWNDHTFSSACATVPEGEPMGEIEKSVYYGGLKKISDWYMDRYIFILYLEFGIGMLFLWRSRREIYQYIPLIAIVGGVLVSLFNETKGRYVLPYVVLMQIFAAVGFGRGLLLLDHKTERKTNEQDKRNASKLPA